MFACLCIQANLFQHHRLLSALQGHNSELLYLAVKVTTVGVGLGGVNKKHFYSFLLIYDNILGLVNEQTLGNVN